MTLQTVPERRRRWSSAKQREIMAAAFMPGAVVADVARRFEVSTSLIHKRRREAPTVRSQAAFVPAVVVADPVCVPAPAPRLAMGPAACPAIAIELAGGTRLHNQCYRGLELKVAAARPGKRPLPERRRGAETPLLGLEQGRERIENSNPPISALGQARPTIRWTSFSSTYPSPSIKGSASQSGALWLRGC